MSLRKKFKVNPDTAANGVWIEFKGNKNVDGSVPGFLIARMSKHNVKYTKEFQESTEQFADEDGAILAGAMSNDEAEDLMLDVFLSAVLLGWRNFEPDVDGEKVEYSKEAARDIFGKIEWLDLYTDISKKATKAATFAAKQQEADLKNS